MRTLKQNVNNKTFLSAQLVNAYEGKAVMVYLQVKRCYSCLFGGAEGSFVPCTCNHVLRL